MPARITEVTEERGKKRAAGSFGCCVGVLYMQVSILALKCCSTVHLFAFILLSFHSNPAFPLAGTLHTFYRWELIWSKRQASVCEQGGSIHPHSISIYIQAPLWGHCSEKRLQSLENNSTTTQTTLLFFKKYGIDPTKYSQITSF